MRSALISTKIRSQKLLYTNEKNENDILIKDKVLFLYRKFVLDANISQKIKANQWTKGTA